MADAADRADQEIEFATSEALRLSTFRVADGDGPGECDECQTHMPRLVNGRCAPCRDGRREQWETGRRV
jgi:hypothetical protein